LACMKCIITVLAAVSGKIHMFHNGCLVILKKSISISIRL
jgi:hypothetical protein